MNYYFSSSSSSSLKFAWFADTAQNAVKELIEREFLVGLVHRFDQLLVMLRYRLGIPTYRDILALSSNHYRHPKAAQWPRVSMQLLNGTGKIQTDWRFLSAAERIYNRQVSQSVSQSVVSVSPWVNG